jgi:acyl transferase domain-containing protein
MPDNSTFVSTQPPRHVQQGVNEAADSSTLQDRAALAQEIKERLAAVLFKDPMEIDENKAFMELGLDSILAVELTKQLEKVFRVEIKATQLYDYSTVKTLAAHLHTLGVSTGKEVSLPAPPIPEQPPITRASHPPSPGRESADVAVIGMSGRFPGADNIYQYWQNLANGVDSVTEVPANRWDVNQYYEPDTTNPNKTYCKWGGFLQDVDQFDPLFFNISPAEAELLDPQQRLFLQEAWRAIEDAGYAADSLSNRKCGVYVGVMSGQEYPSTNMLSAYSILPARISYFLNLKGPAVAIDTACSSSLIALHLACKSLLNGETDMMLAGGVTLFLTEKPYIGMSMIEMLSRDGKCKTFDNKADGFVPGEGVGVVVLKLLEKAIAHGDHIYGVIKGSGINQDGRTNGITAPSAQSQKDLELEVYKNTGINPETVTYVETHGTGTRLGDPIEIEALTEAFRQYTPRKQYCPIGSVKTNIGHASAAAGIASVIKALLALEYRKIPPSLHFQEENEHINFKDSPFYVNTSLIDWKTPIGVPRRTAVSSFGYSGTNAHMIIEEPPELPGDTPPLTLPCYLIPISARNEEVLQHKYKDLLHWLDRENANRYSLEDIAVTLALGRNHFSLRSAFLVKHTAELKQMLTLVGEGKTPGNYLKSKVNPSPPREEEMKEDGTRLLGELQAMNRSQCSEDQYKIKLTALANLYIKGYNPDWSVFYQGRDYRRIALPTYPFARERYWNPGFRQEGSQRTGQGQSQTLEHTPGMPVPPDETSCIQHIRQDLIRLIETLLKVKEKDIDVDELMFQYGFDSITFTEYIKQINKKYDIEFAMESFFDLGNPTIHSLSQYLYKHFKDQFTRYFRQSGPVLREAGGIEPIAIIGLSGAMPQSGDPETFWKHLAEGKRLITPFPKERWGLEMFEEEKKEGSEAVSLLAGCLKEAASFDAEFFGLSPREAEGIDPQQRILLETAWKTIEDAGYKISDLSGSKTGVFIGASDGGYHKILHPAGERREVSRRQGNALSMAANRISFLFNLRGPSEVIDTASSGSMVAVHRGVEALRSGTCSMAIVGGVHIILTPTWFSGGQSDGYIPGEGAGAILLKPLARAAADGDHIYALIKGSAENHSGRSASFKTPDTDTLAECLIDAFTNARLNPNSLTYFEADGIGTGRGDTAEIQALKTVFNQWDKLSGGSLPPGPPQPHCGIGSITPNIGHLEAAAGIAAVIKVLLALKHQTMPVTIGLEEKNPPKAGDKDIESSFLYMVKKTIPWECLDDKENQVIPRRAGISAFGRGGANAHVILEEWPHGQYPQPKAHSEKYTKQGAEPGQGPHLIILSAKNEKRLKAYAAKLKHFLETPAVQSIQPPGPREPTDIENLRQKIEDDILLISNGTLKWTSPWRPLISGHLSVRLSNPYVRIIGSNSSIITRRRKSRPPLPG